MLGRSRACLLALTLLAAGCAKSPDPLFSSDDDARIAAIQVPLGRLRPARSLEDLRLLSGPLLLAELRKRIQSLGFPDGALGQDYPPARLACPTVSTGTEACTILFDGDAGTKSGMIRIDLPDQARMDQTPDMPQPGTGTDNMISLEGSRTAHYADAGDVDFVCSSVLDADHPITERRICSFADWPFQGTAARDVPVTGQVSAAIMLADPDLDQLLHATVGYLDAVVSGDPVLWRASSTTAAMPTDRLWHAVVDDADWQIACRAAVATERPMLLLLGATGTKLSKLGFTGPLAPYPDAAMLIVVRPDLDGTTDPWSGAFARAAGITGPGSTVIVEGRIAGDRCRAGVTLRAKFGDPG